MSFLRNIIRFRFHISDSERGVYEHGDVRINQHIHDSSEEILAMFLVYAREYHPDLVLPGPEDEKVFSRSELDGSLLDWIALGTPTTLQIRQAIGRMKGGGSCKVYFRNVQDEQDFVHQLRGSKTNWVEKVLFFRLDLREFQDWLEICDEQGLPSRIEMDITQVDDILYCSFGDKNLTCPVLRVDIWESFQASLRKEPREAGA